MTVEEFLQLKPQRKPFEWNTNEDGTITLKVPKFKREIGKKLCKLLRRKPFFSANLDDIGSLVWKNCDGDTTVQDILNELEKKYPKEEKLDQRLIHFLSQMKKLGYIHY